MISISNYRSKSADIDWSQLRPDLKEAHQEMLEFYLDLYSDDQDIKETADLYLKQLNDALKKQKPQAEPKVHVVKPSPDKPKTKKKSPQVENSRQKQASQQKKPIKRASKPPFQVMKDAWSKNATAAAPAGSKYQAQFEEWLKERGDKWETEYDSEFDRHVYIKKSQPKKKAKPAAKKPASKKTSTRKNKLPAVRKKDLMRSFPDELKLVKAFYNLVNKEVPAKRWVLLHRRLQKAIVDQAVHPNSKLADLVDTMADKAKKAVEASKSNPGKSITGTLEGKVLERIKPLAKQTAVYPSVKLFKSFIGMQGGNPDQKQLDNLISRIEKAVKSKRIMGTDPFASELKEALEILRSARTTGTISPMQLTMNGPLCGCMEYATGMKAPSQVKKKSKSIKPQDATTAVVLDIAEKVLKEKVSPSYQVNQHDADVDLVEIIMDCEKEFEVNVDDLAADSFHTLQDLIDFLKSKTGSQNGIIEDAARVVNHVKNNVEKGKKLVADTSEILKGLPPELRSKLVSMDKVGDRIERECFQVDGDIGKFLGPVERKPKESVVMTIDADHGAGKTTFLYQLMNATAKRYPTAFFTLEEHKDSSLFERKRDEYIDPAVQQNIVPISSDDFEGMAQLQDIARYFDVIVIDSSKKLPPFELDTDLRKAFDGKLIIIIYQRNQDGTMKGGSDAQFDGDMICKLVKHEGNFNKNYAYWNKNRYMEDEQGYRYFVGPKKLKTAEQVEKEEREAKEKEEAEDANATSASVNGSQLSGPARSKAVNAKARKIRKPGESWNDAVKRASKKV